jgi:uncharacterized RDD family membrane protein YckC
MGALGLNIPKAAPRYRLRRFLAFAIDLAVIILLWFLSYHAIGKPDFASVKSAMDAANALPPESQPEAFKLVFALYDKAFQFGLILWFAYETLTTLLLNGRTLGKLILGLRIVPINPGRSRLLSLALLPVRSFLKVLSLSILQAFPFIICALTVFTSSSRSGFDIFVRTKVAEKEPG